MKRILFAFALAFMAFFANAYQLYTPSGTVDVGYVNFEGLRATYRSQAFDVLPVATATDTFALCGSATKVVRVNRLQLTMTATGASSIDVYIYKRTTANTGGTSALSPIAKMDSLDPTPTATFKVYSANPSTLGTGVLLTGDSYALPAKANSGFAVTPWIEDFGTRNGKAVVLRGVNECLNLSFNGQTIPSGLAVYYGVEWTEE